VIDASQALEKARGYLEEFIPDFAALDPKVEEIAVTPDSSAWKITFYAYRGDRSEATTLAELLRFRRIEKVVVVSAPDGALIGISNPHPASLAS
jgi:hypothetical protein